MKKKILAIIALMLILAMGGINVFAAEMGQGGPGGGWPGSGGPGGPGSGGPGGPDNGWSGGPDNGWSGGDTIGGNNPGGSLSSQAGLYLMGSAGDDGSNNFIQITIDPNGRNEKYDVNIGMVAVEDTEFDGLEEQQLADIRTEVDELEQLAQARGFNSVDVIGFAVESTETSKTLEFLDERISESDKANGLVEVYHQLKDGTWEAVDFTTLDGRVVATFNNGFSPVIIVKYSYLTENGNYAQKLTNTISGSAPKTTDAFPYAIIVAIVSLACVLICTRKLSKR